MSDEPRRRILERRARFVTAAIASAGLAACRPCLSMVPTDPPPDGPSGADASADATGSNGVSDAGTDTGLPPVPCLSPMIADTGTTDPSPALDGGSQGKQPDAGPPPMPCLKIAPPPPKACLDVPSGS